MPSIESYVTAADYLGNKQDRPLPGRNTRLQRRDDHTIAVRYSDTDVVTYHDDGTITLRTNGWHTVTTRERMSTYAPGFTSLRQYHLYHGTNRVQPPSLVYDGMVLDSTGNALQPRYADDAHERVVKARIDAYVNGFGREIAAGHIGNPGSGDCFYCQFGTLGGDIEHITSHCEEAYYVPSLLYRAVSARGFVNAPLIFNTITSTKDDKWGKQLLRQYLRKVYLRDAIDILKADTLPDAD